MNGADEKASRKMKNREKKLWNRFMGTVITLPPIFLQRKTKFSSRYWDFESTTPAAPLIGDDEWEELRYCRYLREPTNRFRRPADIYSTL